MKATKEQRKNIIAAAKRIQENKKNMIAFSRKEITLAELKSRGVNLVAPI